MQNLHLAHNYTLVPNDKFTKVRPLIEKLDELCFLLYLPEQVVSSEELHNLEGMDVNHLLETSHSSQSVKSWVPAIPLRYAI